MFKAEPIHVVDKTQHYQELAEQMRGLLSDERDRIANAANFSSLVFNSLPALNWAGFYFYDGIELVVGPFQGKPACVRIALGKGVCGTAAARRETLIVPDVLAFPGHIACDAASRSEIVVPILDGGALLGVLDVDAPEKNRFGEADRAVLEECVRVLLPRVDWKAL